MPITFPVSLPTSPGPAGITIRPRSIVAITQSPFTGKQQVQAGQNEMLEAEVRLPLMTRAQAAEWIATLMSLNGREGTFYLPAYEAATPRGSWTGTPVVDGASQTGKGLDIRGLTPSQTNIARKGDVIQIGDYMYYNMTDQNSTAGGLATLDIYPRLRTSPADGAAIITSNAKGKFRLTSNDMPFDVDEAMHYAVSFSAIEAL